MSANNLLLFFFSALGAFNGLLLSIYFAINAQRKIFTNYFLAFLLFVLSIRILKSVFFYFNPGLANSFIQVGLSACVLIGPFLYLYLKTDIVAVKTNWFWHIVPSLLVMIVLAVLYPYVAHRNIWSRWIVKAIYAQWLVYLILSASFVPPILKKVTSKERLKKLETWQLSIYLGVFCIWLAYNIAAYTSYIVGALSFTFILYLIVLLLIYKASSDNSFFQEKEKYKNKEIEESVREDICKKIAAIKDRELFLNPGFSLDTAAGELKISKHLLSQYINEVMGKSFSQLIKEYRIEKAKSLLLSKSDYTIEGLGYDSGFNSKSAFFTAFKQITGLTPAEFQKHSKK